MGPYKPLIVNDFLDFNKLKDLLEVTDGNLASHLKTLENKNYIGYKKEFRDRKPNTKYYATDKAKRPL